MTESPLDPEPEGTTGDASSGGDLIATGSDDGPDDGPSTGSAETEETDGCETDGCEAEEGYECLTSLAWNGELVATANRSAVCTDCGKHEGSQGVLLAVDAKTGERTELGFAEVRQTFETLAIAPDGGLVVAGSTFIPETLSELPLLQKYSPEGELLWTAPSDFEVADFAIRGEQILVVSSHGTTDVTVVSDADGSIVEQISGGEGRTQSIAVDGEGNVYVAGDITELVDGMVVGEEAFVRKYDPELQLLWEDALPPSVDGAGLVAQGLVADESGGAIAAFRQAPEDSSGALIVFRKYDDAGAFQWDADFDGGDPGVVTNDYVFEMKARPGGGLIAVGQTSADGEVSAFTVAYGSDGASLWSDEQAHPGLSHEINEGLAIGAEEVVVAGCARGEPHDLGWLLEFEP